MNAVKKHLSLINKNAFQKAMIKITWGEDMQLAKEKHFQMIINTLLGQNDKITQEEGVKVIVDYLQQIVIKKWMRSLKTLMLVHYVLNTIPKKLQPLISQYVDAPVTQSHESTPLKGDNNIETNLSTNQKKIYSGIIDQNCQKRSGSIPRTSSKYAQGNTKINQNISSSSSAQQIDIVHQILVQKYYDYVIIYNEKLDNINYLAGKNISNWRSFVKEYQKIKSVLILFTYVQQFMRELEASLTNFKKVLATQRIACLLSNNLMQSYTILKHIVTSVQGQYREFDIPSDLIRFFNFYSDFITITKNMQKFNYLQTQICPQFVNDFTTIELYKINKELNRDIELYHLNVRSKRRILNERSQAGNDFMSVGVSTQSEVSPLKFTNLLAKSEMCFQQNLKDKNKQQKGVDDYDEESVFSNPAYICAKIDRPQSANPLQNKQNYVDGRFAKQNNIKSAADDSHSINGNESKDIQENEAKPNNSKKNSKETISTFKIIKLDQEEANQSNILLQNNDIEQEITGQQSEQDKEQNSLKLINNSSQNRKASTPFQTNSDFKVSSKQFYDVKNNPLSFLKSSSLSQEPNKKLIGGEEEKKNDIGGNGLKQKCNSLNENEHNQNDKDNNNGENDLTQDFTSSKNATAECSPPQKIQQKLQNDYQVNKNDFNKGQLQMKKKVPVKVSHHLNSIQKMELKSNQEQNSD